MCATACMWRSEFGSLLPPHGSQASNLGHQIWWQGTFFTFYLLDLWQSMKNTSSMTKALKTHRMVAKARFFLTHWGSRAMKVCFLKPLKVWNFEHTSRSYLISKAASATHSSTVFGCLLSGVLVQLVRLASAGRSCLYYKDPSRQPNESIKASAGCDQPSLARCPGPQLLLLLTGQGQV